MRGNVVMLRLGRLLALTVFLSACSPAWQDARHFLKDLSRGGDVELAREVLAYAIGEHRYEGDLYRPVGRPQAGIVLVPGVAEQGRDDPRLVSFAGALARSGFLVLVPEIGSLRELRVQPEDARSVADAFLYLRSRPELSESCRAGIAAFSYAAGPAVLAAMQPELRDKVDFVLAVGGYYDLPAVVTYLTTGHVREGGAWAHRLPNPYGKWVFVLGNLDRLQSAEDRRLLEWIARDRLANGGNVPGEIALGDEGRAILSLLVNQDPQSVAGLLAALPQGVREDIEALDLANKDLATLRSQMILVHGTDDDLIPSGQSMALASALPAGQVELFLVDGLAHVDLMPEGLDSVQLLRAVSALMRQRVPCRRQ